MGRNVGSVEVEFRADKRQLKDDLNSLERDLGMATGRMKKDTQNLNYHMAKQFRDMGKQFRGLGANFADMSDFTSKAVRLSVEELAALPDGLRGIGLELDKEATYMKHLGKTTTTTLKEMQKSVEKTRVGFSKMTSMTSVGKDVTSTLNDIRDASKKAQLAALGLNEEGIRISPEQSRKEMEKFQQSIEKTQRQLYELRAKGNFLAFNEGMRQLDEEISKVNVALKSTANNGKGAYQIMRNLGIVTSDMANANALAMERYKDRIIMANDMLLQRTTMSEKQMKAIDGIKMYGLSKQLLKVGKSLEQRAKEGNAFNLALKRLGKDAPFKEIQEEMRRIQTNAQAIPTIWAGFAIATALSTAGLVLLSNEIDGRLIPAAEEFKKTWVDALRPFVRAFTTAMEKVIEFGTWIGKLAKNFAEAHPQLSQMVWGFLYLTLVLGTLLAPLGVAAGWLGSFKAVFAVLYSTIQTFVPALLTVLGVAMLFAAVLVTVIAVINNLWKNSEAFRDAWVDLWDRVKTAFTDNFVTPVSEAWDRLKTAFSDLIATFTGGEGTMSNLWTFLGDKIAIVVNYLADKVLPILEGAFSVLADVVVAVIDGIVFAVEWLGDVWAEHGDEITTTLQTIWDYVELAFGAIKSYLETVMPEIEGIVTDTFDAIRVAIDFVMKYIAPVVMAGFGIMLQIVQVLMPVILQIVQGTWNNITSVITSAIAIIRNIIQFFSNVLSGDWRGAWNNVKNIFKNVITLIWNLVQLYFLGKLLAPLRGFAKAGRGLVSGAWKGFLGIIRGVMNAVKVFVVGVWQAILSALRGRFTGIANLARTVFNGMKNTVTNIFNGIKNTAKNVWDKVRDTIVNPIESAKDKVISIIGKITGAFAKMKISIPKFKMPSISVGSKSFLDGKVKIPTFKVTWNAKGNIFNGASLLGGGQGVDSPALSIRNGRVINQVNSVKAKFSYENMLIPNQAVKETYGRCND